MLVFLACVQVPGDRIRAVDLARAIPAFASVDPQQVIGFTPLPGLERVFTVPEIGLLSRRLGVSVPESDGSTVCFARETQVLTTSAILDAVVVALGRSDVRGEVVDFLRTKLPNGTLVFSVNAAARPPLSDSDAPTMWRGSIRTESGQTFAVWAKIRVTVESNAVLASRRIVKGELIQEGDVALSMVKRSPLSDPTLNSLESVMGKCLKQTVEIGGIIGPSNLENVREVLAGEYAHVDSEIGLALVSLTARAQTAGRAGDTILMQNPANGRMFRALVTGKGRVRALGGSFH